MLNLGTGHFSSPVCLLCVEGGGGEGDRFFFRGGGGVGGFSGGTAGGGGDGMVFKGDPGEISRQRQNLKKGL